MIQYSKIEQKLHIGKGQNKETEGKESKIRHKEQVQMQKPTCSHT